MLAAHPVIQPENDGEYETLRICREVRNGAGYFEETVLGVRVAGGICVDLGMRVGLAW